MSDEEAARKLRVALELADTGLALMRENLRRRYPEASEKDLDHLMSEWLQRRPPDGPGTIRTLR